MSDLQRTTDSSARDTNVQDAVSRCVEISRKLSLQAEVVDYVNSGDMEG